MDGRDDPVITIPAPVRGFVDRRAADGGCGRRRAAAALRGRGRLRGLSFPGAVIYEATGAGAGRAYDTLFDTVSSGATWGICQSTLGRRAQPVAVGPRQHPHRLAAARDADQRRRGGHRRDPSLNLILVGRQGAWEYVNFTTATLNGDGTYTLSGFKRGRRGTEWACAGHAAGEAWVLASSLEADEMGLDDVGAALSFKAQSIGRVARRGSADRRRPVHRRDAEALCAGPSGVEHGRNRHVRRDRPPHARRRCVGRRLDDSAVGEFGSLRGRRLQRLDVQADDQRQRHQPLHLHGGEIAADGNSVGTPPPVNVYQMSDAVGRGFALAA
jgi:hypothetical protein